MKFSCEKYLLQSACAVASRAAASKSPIPALEGLLISADDRVRVKGYDLKKGIVTAVDADISERGEVVVGARLFGEMIRRLPDGIVTITADEKDNILSLRLTLVDGKAYDFVYDVGKLIRYIDPEGKVEQRIRYREDLRHLQLEVNLPDPIDLPEVDPTTDTGAGFDARVADWEDGGVIDMGGF